MVKGCPSHLISAIYKEPVYHQVIDLHILVGDDYDWIGVGRDDGKEQGEYSAIFYKK
jgi:hypothetical protein